MNEPTSEMPVCEKRNAIEQVSKDGTKQVIYRCAHLGCHQFAQAVTPDICESCPLRVFKEKKPAPQGAPAPKRSRGVGDTIKKITAKVGITPCAACEKRAETLNRWLPYRQA